MSFRQKIALVSVVALVLMYGWYFAEFWRARATGEVGVAATLALAVPTVLGVALLQIVGTALVAIFSAERRAPIDERERLLSARSQQGAYWVLLTGALAAAASGFLRVSAMDVANVALLAVVLAEIVRYGGYVLLHRAA
jgi:hypothetical protein